MHSTVRVANCLLAISHVYMYTHTHTHTHTHTCPMHSSHTDIRELVQVDDVMEDEDLKLGPNGGLIFCME